MRVESPTNPNHNAVTGDKLQYGKLYRCVSNDLNSQYLGQIFIRIPQGVGNSKVVITSLSHPNLFWEHHGTLMFLELKSGEQVVLTQE